ncbi:hypothetical protein GCM10023225_10680 [Kineococcus glutinatus]|uniref:Uncharacterized protein n=1 Tax=Kineococcus glutinatus TaxID=1070872 RepID=A0ABP9HGL5_9ACTN
MSTPAPDGTAHRVRNLLMQATQPTRGELDSVHALVDRAKVRGRSRLWRRRAVLSVGTLAAASLTAGLVLTWPSSSGSSQLIQRAQPAASAPDPMIAPTPFIPPVVGPGAEDLEDHVDGTIVDIPPGDPTMDWRGQVRQSMQEHPGPFVLPEQLPPDVLVVLARSAGGYPVIDVSTESGPAVTLCAGELERCKRTAPGFNVLRTGELNLSPYVVLVSDPGAPTEKGLNEEQLQYWEDVVFTTSAPQWLQVTE